MNHAIDAPSLISTNNVVTLAVTLVLLVSRLGAGASVAGVRTWLCADVLLWACRGWLALHLGPALGVLQDPVPVAGTLAAAALTLHLVALRRASGRIDSWARVATAIGATAALFLLGHAAFVSLGARIAWVHLLVFSFCAANVAVLWPSRHGWGARVLMGVSVLGMVYNGGALAHTLWSRMSSPTVEPQAVLAAVWVDLLISLVLSGGFLLLMQERLRERIERLVVTDALTGVLNRHGLMPQLQREMSRAEQQHVPLSVTLFDLDHFKRVNDLRGHGTGDAVLAGFATKVTSMLRESDIFGRWGGEEFLLVLPHTPLDDAFSVCDRIRAGVADAPLAEGAPRITLSAGVASTSEISASARHLVALLSRADERLYRAKETRNRVVAADTSPPRESPADPTTAPERQLNATAAH